MHDIYGSMHELGLENLSHVNMSGRDFSVLLPQNYVIPAFFTFSQIT